MGLIAVWQVRNNHVAGYPGFFIFRFGDPQKSLGLRAGTRV